MTAATVVATAAAAAAAEKTAKFFIHVFSSLSTINCIYDRVMRRRASAIVWYTFVGVRAPPSLYPTEWHMYTKRQLTPIQRDTRWNWRFHFIYVICSQLILVLHLSIYNFIWFSIKRYFFHSFSRAAIVFRMPNVIKMHNDKCIGGGRDWFSDSQPASQSVSESRGKVKQQHSANQNKSAFARIQSFQVWSAYGHITVSHWGNLRRVSEIFV